MNQHFMFIWLFWVYVGILPGYVVSLAATSTSTTSGSSRTSNSFFLAKTCESFKLSELQFAEVNLQANANGYTITRLMMDYGTGSMILKLENFSKDRFLSDPIHRRLLPSSLRRCDWILEVLTEGETPERLMKNLRGDNHHHDCLKGIQDGWILDYYRLEESGPSVRSPPTYTMKTLMCSVAQFIPSLPALDPKTSTGQYLLVDTICDSDHKLFFGHILYHHSSRRDVETSLFSERKWSLRPYQYSSAFNPKAAEIIMDWLTSRIQSDSLQQPSSSSLPPLLLDPTCGSGTFLALGIEHGWRVEGYDVNINCVEGCTRNLQHMFGDETIKTMVHIECRDSSTEFKTTTSSSSDFPSGVVANLPWGINSVDYQNENEKILTAVRTRLKPSTPCVFITRNAESKLFQDTGYEIVTQVRIPPKDFKLPKSKKLSNQDETGDRSGRNHCFVTMVTSTK